MIMGETVVMSRIFIHTEISCWLPNRFFKSVASGGVRCPDNEVGKKIVGIPKMLHEWKISPTPKQLNDPMYIIGTL